MLTFSLSELHSFDSLLCLDQESNTTLIRLRVVCQTTLSSGDVSVVIGWQVMDSATTATTPLMFVVSLDGVTLGKVGSSDQALHISSCSA
mgnify:CR=1 FL=1